MFAGGVLGCQHPAVSAVCSSDAKERLRQYRAVAAGGRVHLARGEPPLLPRCGNAWLMPISLHSEHEQWQ